jgi:hypothetical protein
MTEQELIKELLRPLFADYEEEIVPASENLLSDFRQQAVKRNIPNEVVEQLTEFYKVSNGVPCLNGFAFFACDEELLFDWWDNQEIWLGTKDDDVLRWADNKYCLGDAANVSYGNEYEFFKLYELLKFAFEDWNL